MIKDHIGYDTQENTCNILMYKKTKKFQKNRITSL